jgi:hypothetical protein
MMLDDLQERWPELRDPAGWHEAGLPLGTADERCALLLDLACRVAFTFSCPRYAGLDASKVAAAAVDADPDCLFAHTTSLAVRLIGGGKGAAAQALDRAVKCCATSRACHSQWERGHLAAVRTYASADDTEVGRMYGELVRAYPFDVLALRLAFMANSPARRRVLLRNTQAVIPHWQRRWRRQQQEQQQEQRDDHDGTDGCAPGSLYPFVLGEHSYALGENERYEESEQFARRALHLNRNCSLSTHQMAHIFEMTGRFAEGADFLRATEKDWRLAGQATHIYWHWSILHVGQQRGHGQHESDKSTALELFDRTLATARRDDAAGARALSKCVNDLASLLFRLFLADAGGVGGAGGGSDAGSGVTALRQRLAERAQVCACVCVHRPYVCAVVAVFRAISARGFGPLCSQDCCLLCPHWLLRADGARDRQSAALDRCTHGLGGSRRAPGDAALRGGAVCALSQSL